MTELLFHHYDQSPFSEKIRLCFGRKGLSWRSVIQPQIMPKPHLVPLTGGYRRIPVLQIGADVYCDSQLIVRVLERLHPEPTLFPAFGPGVSGSEGLSFAISLWADRLLFQATVPVLFSRIGSAVPEAFIEDRKQLMGGQLDFRAVMAAGPLAADQLRAHLGLLETELRDGRPYLLGATFSLADASAYHPVWFLLSVAPVREVLDEFPWILAWAERVRAVGHGRRSECPPEEALRIAREARPATAPARDPRDPKGLGPGTRVRVVPDDYGFDPVEGELVASTPQEVALLRSAPEVGEVVVHFPRAGFRVTAL
jgi:glutathione S-transferase